jgi:hypothetical protein
VTDAAAVKSGGAATHNKNGYHHEVHEDHEGRNVFKTRFLLLCPIFVAFVIFVVSKCSDAE